MESMDRTMIVKSEDLERTLDIGFKMLCVIPDSEYALNRFLTKIDITRSLKLISWADHDFLWNAAWAVFYEGCREVRSALGRQPKEVC